MFQFRRFPAYAYLIQRTLTGYCPAGLPHSEICGSMDICSSPQLIAACHVLRRLLMPRHSPCALISLTNHSQDNSCSLIVNYAGFTDFVEIVIVTLIFSDVVPQLKLLVSVPFQAQTSLLPYLSLSLYIVQFSRCSFQLLKPD